MSEQTMRRPFAIFLLFVIGCGTSSSNSDTEAARKFIQGYYNNAEFDLVEGPEYADIPNIPKKAVGKSPKDRPAACAVRIKFTFRDENRTTHDEWIVWVNSDHKAFDWSGNDQGDKWRKYVQSFAKK